MDIFKQCLFSVLFTDICVVTGHIALTIIMLETGMNVLNITEYTFLITHTFNRTKKTQEFKEQHDSDKNKYFS